MGHMIEKALSELREHGVGVFMKHFINYIGRNLKNIMMLPFVIIKLKMSKKENDREKLVDFAYTGCNGLISIFQIRSEIIDFVKILDQHKPSFILEIGTAGGGTLFLFSKIASADARIISLDLPGGPFGGGYPFYKIPLYNSYRNYDQELYLVRGDSHKSETLNKVKNILGNNNLDLLFIDGDHTYEGVVQDFELYSPLVRSNGIIAFHDIVESSQDGYGVSKFWREIKEKYVYEEIVDNWDQGGFGIGVIKMA